jgi:simple sugar transport system permease protein
MTATTADQVELWRTKAATVLLHIVRSTVPVVIALLLGAVILRVADNDPFAVYQVMFREAFGDGQRLAATLTASTPLLFTGLATAISFRAGSFSLGAETGFIAGGLAAAWLGAAVHLPAIVMTVLCLGLGVVVGAASAWPAAWLKARLGVDEVVTTLMLNFVAMGVIAWLVNGYLLAPGEANSSTKVLPIALPVLAPPSQLNIGIVFAVLLVVVYAFSLRRTVVGFELRQVGLNARFAAAQGISASRTILSAMLVTGAVAGLGGAVHALGIVHRYVVGGFSASYGFTGIAVALLAGRSALALIPAAVLFGAFANAGTTIQLFDNIPLDIVQVLQGTVMVFAVANLALLWRRRRGAR